MFRRTTSCKQHKHREFRLQYDRTRVIEEDVAWFITHIERAVANGEKFSDGQTFQVGWMITLIRNNDEGGLTICEPDFTRFPIAWVDGVNETLKQLRLHKDVCESVLTSNELVFPSILQTAIVCSQLGNDDGYVLRRDEPDGNDSGWFFGCDDQDHDHNDPKQLSCVSLFQAAVQHGARIIPYLALPPETLVFDGYGVLNIGYKDELLPLKEGSYLHTLQSAE